MLPIILGLFLGVLFCGGTVLAAPIEDESFFYVKKNKVEVTVSNESVAPHSVYGNWKAMSLQYSQKAAVDFTWFAQFDMFARNAVSGGNGNLATLGAYKDWNDSFYTYTAFSAGSKVDYLQKFRVDHNFYLKFGADKQYVWNIGGSYIDYHNDRSDKILSTGITVYDNRWSYSFDILRTVSSPGSVTSYTRQFTITQGKERQAIGELVYAYGKEAYLAADVLLPMETRNNSKLWSFSYRRWLGLERDHGYVFGVSYFDLQDGYRSTTFSFGLFREY